MAKQSTDQQAKGEAKSDANDKVRIKVHKDVRTDQARRFKPGEYQLTEAEIKEAGLKEDRHFVRLD